MCENRPIYGKTLFDKTTTVYEIIKSNELEQRFDVLHDGAKMTDFGPVEIAQICRKMIKGMENTLFDMLQSDYNRLTIRMSIDV